MKVRTLSPASSAPQDLFGLEAQLSYGLLQQLQLLLSTVHNSVRDSLRNPVPT